MKINYLIFSLTICLLVLSGCRFTLDESEYVGHYEGTYRLGNFIPNEGNMMLDITPTGNHLYDITVSVQGYPSFSYTHWKVERYSQGLYGVAARIYKPGGFNDDIYVSKYDHHAVMYLNDSVNLNFSGDRIY